MEELIVKNEIIIDAPIAKVWEVLIAPKFIRQWDSLPQDFPDYYLETGMEINWSGNSKITVAEMLPHEYLKLSLFVYNWELGPSSYNIAYHYRLVSHDNHILLSIEIGDFGQLPDGQEYYDASVEFADKALNKIKLLAENRW
ncbi:SRPBCC domain-containing protein [Dyadobacter sp. NIV53]|uniref:SRPBCC domain-containing protein n=1 Tax=Dyadobacter sp. NIV53 TaxID=2861765 RepID=UPI001C875FFE|nr:SRPBCC domain-containing protein [Dyadobacter sp. NIV53]